MSRIDGYTVYNASYQKSIHNNEKTEKTKNKSVESRTVEKKEGAKESTAKKTELSQAAKDLLKEMKKKYGDMDFFVADYSSDEEAQKYLSRGTKDYSVLIEPELLEEMAADNAAKEKYLGVIDEAKNKIAELKGSISKMENSGNDDKKSNIKSLGFSIKEDGTLSFFAEIEKSSVDQKKRIEQSREEKRAQKKEDEKVAKTKKMKDDQQEKVKRSLIHGDSVDELLKKIQSFDWESVSEETIPKTGGRLDVAI